MSDDKQLSEVPIVSAESIGAMEVCEAGVEDLFAELVDRGVTPEQAAEGLRRVIEQEATLPPGRSADGDI
jgi:hypothetical protein